MDEGLASLTIKLEGPEEAGRSVTLDAFAGFCKAFQRCVREVEKLAPVGERSRFEVADLQCASATLTIAPDSAKGAQVLGLFSETVNLLREGETPSALSDPLLNAFRDLVRPYRNDGYSVLVDGLDLTDDYLETVDRLLEGSFKAQGEISGRLEKLNVHNKREFVIYPPIGLFHVTCRFPKALMEDVRRAVKRHVTVRGTLYYIDESFPSRAVASEIEIHPESDQLPSLYDLRGTMKLPPGGKDSVQLVRALRDAQE